MSKSRITVQVDLDLHDIDALVRAYAAQAHQAASGVSSGSPLFWSIDDAVSRLVLAMAWREQLTMTHLEERRIDE